MSASVPVSPDTDIPFDRVAAFLRQLTHDVRNNLNAMDLQAAYAVELISDPEAADEVRRIRQLIQQATKQLQQLSGNFQTPHPNLVDYSAKIFVEDLQDRLKKTFPEQAGEVEWSVNLGDESVDVDLELVFSAIAELFRNAFQFREAGGAIRADVTVENARMVFRLIEAKSGVPSEPASWGNAPLISTRRGGYGLGLFRARRILEVQGATLSFSHNSTSAQLITTVTLPLATEDT